MSGGFVDLEIRFRDQNSGQGIALDSLIGTVKNSLGNIVDTVIPIAYSDADGVYYSVVDYDIRNAANFAGIFLTVDWLAARYGVAFPIIEKRYYYQPISEEFVDKTILFWLRVPTPNNVYFYEIHRTKTDGTDEVAGLSFGPSFVDTNPFANEFEARAWRYKIYSYSLALDAGIQPDGSDYKKDPGVTEPYFVARTGSRLCVLTGYLAGLAGMPVTLADTTVESSSVVFRVNWRDRWQIIQNTIISGEDIYVGLSGRGGFTIPLLQDTIVEMAVPMINFAARFIVPRKSQATLSDLTLEILRE